MHFFKTICAALLIAAATHAHADKVIGIADGDTMTILHNRQPLKLRLAEIDAPEKAQAFGQKSKQSLSQLCWGKDASYQVQDIDRYGRTVARVTCDGVDVNRTQVARGMAWVYRQYSHDPALAATEQSARNARVGLWRDPQPVPPWEFRHPSGHARQHASREASSVCFTGPRGGHYRMIDGHKRYGC